MARQFQPPSLAITATDIANALPSDVAKKSDIPLPAIVAPPDTTANTPVTGDLTTRYALANHTHPTRVQRAISTLDANGLADWQFTTPFDNEPSVPMPAYREQTDNLPIIVKVKDFWREKNAAGVVVTPNGVLESAGGTGRYVGVQYKATRLSNTVTPTGVQVLGVNVLSALSINIASGTGLNGVKIYCQAAPNT